MQALVLHEFHHSLGARFGELAGAEVVAHYGDPPSEETALHQTAGILDLSFRGRLCLVGADRLRFLHGQVTNDIKKLRASEGCYAALVTAKGRMESDLNVFCLAEEVLLDFEAGLTTSVTPRLERFIVADDVQVVDVAPHYGLLSIQGPLAAETVEALQLFSPLPTIAFSSTKAADSGSGEIYLANHSRLGSHGFDLFVPLARLQEIFETLLEGGKRLGASACGWSAFEAERIAAGIPRYGADMDETTLPQETGIEAQAVSYTKGCYIGQEVLNRLHTMGHVNRYLVGLELAQDLSALPKKGDSLAEAGKQVGNITSAARSARLGKNLGLGYVRRELAKPGTLLTLRSSEVETSARIAAWPSRL